MESSHYQPDLFQPERWPRRPYCTQDLSHGVRVRDLQRALTMPYISANPPYLRVWSIFDIDRPGAALAWEDANLLPPAWAAVNPVNAHAHLVWGLSAPVLVDGAEARQAPMRFLAAVESMMREKLGADPGFGGLMTKNPRHERWRVWCGPRLAYELGELAESLPGLEKHRPRRGAESIGLGRNCTLFDTVRKWAYRAVRQYWGGGLHGWNAWQEACFQRALVYNGDLFGGRLLSEPEVRHIARSTGKWVWKNTSEAGFAKRQAFVGKRGGVASGAARLAQSEQHRATARLMRASGQSTRAIAAALGVNQSTIVRWCAEGPAG